jgi:hypothetical protein
MDARVLLGTVYTHQGAQHAAAVQCRGRLTRYATSHRLLQMPAAMCTMLPALVSKSIRVLIHTCDSSPALALLPTLAHVPRSSSSSSSTQMFPSEVLIKARNGDKALLHGYNSLAEMCEKSNGFAEVRHRVGWDRNHARCRVRSSGGRCACLCKAPAFQLGSTIPSRLYTHLAVTQPNKTQQGPFTD